MVFNDINPYVRFARNKENRIPYSTTVALDHRIFYCLSDSATIEVGGKTYELKKASVIFWKAGIPYRNLTKSSSVCAAGFNFDFFSKDIYPVSPVSYIEKENFRKDMLVEKNLSEELSFLPDCIFLPYFPFKEKFEEICDEYLRKELYHKERCSALLKEILILVFRMNNCKEIYKPKKSGEDILSYIRDNYNKKLTNAIIASHFSYHPNYVSMLIKKRTGLPLHKYINSYRINMAINLLASGNYSITETALKTGFCDIKHFSKNFKKLTGESPKKYILKE